MISFNASVKNMKTIRMITDNDSFSEKSFWLLTAKEEIFVSNHLNSFIEYFK